MRGKIETRPGGKSETARQMAIAMAGQGKRVVIYCRDLAEAVHDFQCTMERLPHLTQSPWHDPGPPGIDAKEHSIAIGLGGELRFIKADPDNLLEPPPAIDDWLDDHSCDCAATDGMKPEFDGRRVVWVPCDPSGQNPGDPRDINGKSSGSRFR